MSDIRSSRADSRLLPGWIVFAVLNGAAMLVWPDQETIPFHFIWISLSVVYGLEAWPHRRMLLILGAVTAFSSLAITRSIVAGLVDWQELTEVPLMAMVFLAMVWHVQRRRAAYQRIEVLAESERRAHEVKELFVRKCSHQMRTPLTVARGYTELVREEMVTERTQEDLDVVLGELSTLDQLAGRLVTLADAYRSHEFRLEPVDLAVLLERTVTRWRPTVDRAWEVLAQPVIVQADASRLASALDTLLENAVKFTLPGDRIAMRCHRRGGAAVIEVEDAGIGLASSALSAGPPYSTGGRGTGLGLSIVQAIIDGHQGSVELLDAATRGTIVRLRLPAPSATATVGSGRVGAPLVVPAQTATTRRPIDVVRR